LFYTLRHHGFMPGKSFAEVIFTKRRLNLATSDVLVQKIPVSSLSSIEAARAEDSPAHQIIDPQSRYSTLSQFFAYFR
jgi:hypothetical protein